MSATEAMRRTLLSFVLFLLSHFALAASSELCNGVLGPHGAFNYFAKEKKKSAKEKMFEWLQTATWQEFSAKQNMGLKLVLPIEGVPVGADGTYSKEDFSKFEDLRNQGKLRNFSDDEFEQIVKLSASPTIANDWLACMKINQDPRGMTCWDETDDRLEDGMVTYRARYFSDSTLSSVEPTVAKKGGLVVTGGAIVEPNRLAAKMKVPIGGVAVQIKRDKKSAVTVALNSERHGACNTVIFPRIEDSVAPPFKIVIFSKTSVAANHPDVSVGFPAGLGIKLIGGGALANWHGAGSLLVASFPDISSNSWIARSKDHVAAEAATVTAWAIGLVDPKNEWDVKVLYTTIPTKSYIAGKVTSPALPSDYFRTGGGAASEFSGEGRLLTGSYPDNSQGTAWTAVDKDHLAGHSMGGSLTAYVIGIKSKSGSNLDGQIHQSTGSIAQHPIGAATLDSGYLLTGGGARTNCVGGNLLTGSYPRDSLTWEAEAKDHDPETGVGCPSSIDVWALGVKPPPGSLYDEGSTDKLDTFTAFSTPMLVSATSVQAYRPSLTVQRIQRPKYYVSRWGDTLLTISLRLYGKPDWTKLRGANTWAGAGPLIPPGTRIIIP